MLVRTRFPLERALIGGDRFVPETEPNENVRWHVLRMRRRGCDLRVATGGIEPERGELRRIVGVDDVVREPWVLREAAEQRIQDRRGLPLPGEGRVAGRCGRDERERVIDRHLGIGGKVAVDAG